MMDPEVELRNWQKVLFYWTREDVKDKKNSGGICATLRVMAEQWEITKEERVQMQFTMETVAKQQGVYRTNNYFPFGESERRIKLIEQVMNYISRRSYA